MSLLGSASLAVVFYFIPGPTWSRYRGQEPSRSLPASLSHCDISGINHRQEDAIGPHVTVSALSITIFCITADMFSWTPCHSVGPSVTAGVSQTLCHCSRAQLSPKSLQAHAGGASVTAAMLSRTVRQHTQIVSHMDFPTFNRRVAWGLMRDGRSRELLLGA